MKRISAAGSDQIKIGLWRSTFTDLKALLDTWCGDGA
jgi:hypothetical protein